MKITYVRKNDRKITGKTKNKKTKKQKNKKQKNKPSGRGRKGVIALFHICKPFDSLCKALDGFIGVSVFYSVPDAVFYVSLKNDLSNLVQGGFGGVYLRKYILAGYILVYHTVYGLYLAYYFFEPPVQILRIHALFHSNTSRNIYLLSAVGGIMSIKKSVIRSRVQTMEIIQKNIYVFFEMGRIILAEIGIDPIKHKAD